MKKAILLFATFVLTINLTQSQNYIQTTSSSSGYLNELLHNGGLIIGQKKNSNALLNITNTSTSYPFQIYTPNSNQSLGMVLGNGSGRFGFNIAGGNGAYHPIATPGTGVIWKLGQNHNIIINMANSSSNYPSYDTTNWNSPYTTSITLNDQANHHTLKVYNTGKVTMGTPKYDNDSNYRLYVKDGIKTERIKVEVASNNGWADYVFKESYVLPNLYEVENFVKKNKHLPEVPNEKEVIENGIELKEMNILLLKKIEELTLYTIKQQKLIDEMKKDLEDLKDNKR
jgi:hypothetical protein